VERIQPDLAAKSGFRLSLENLMVEERGKTNACLRVRRKPLSWGIS
jgi:hypothetical protein